MVVLVLGLFVRSLAKSSCASSVRQLCAPAKCHRENMGPYRRSAEKMRRYYGYIDDILSV